MEWRSRRGPSEWASRSAATALLHNHLACVHEVTDTGAASPMSEQQDGRWQVIRIRERRVLCREPPRCKVLCESCVQVVGLARSHR